jgi:exonuclease SbcC
LASLIQRSNEATETKRQAELAMAGHAKEVQMLAEDAGKPEDLQAALAALGGFIQAKQTAAEALHSQVAELEQEDRDTSTRVGTLQTQRDALLIQQGETSVRLDQSRLAMEAELVRSGFLTTGAVLEAVLPEKEIQEATGRIQAHAKELGEVEAVLADLQERLANQQRPELAPLETAVALAREAREAALEGQNQARSIRDAHKDRLLRWKALEKRRTNLQANGGIYVDLAADLQGKGANGRIKLSFPSFVLGRWFALVLERASGRMQVLTGGRYRFVHNADGWDRKRPIGLDFEVEDADTLSGGEKFLASMSLALGLSDVIQERSGGRRMEALFIDEGFGSLDGVTLDTALAVLEEIGEGRQVGIISHVESLKREIGSRIDVIKGATGSRLEMAG